MQQLEKQVKVVLIGDQGVGKTSISNVFVNDKFNQYENATPGAAFSTKHVIISNTPISFNIWDTAGQEKFRSLVGIYYRDARAAILVYDITCAKSFECIREWAAELEMKNPSAFKVIVANKMDLIDKEQVGYDQAKQYAESIGCTLKLVSAKEKNGIEDVFTFIGENLVEQDSKIPQQAVQSEVKQRNIGYNDLKQQDEPNDDEVLSGQPSKCC